MNSSQTCNITSLVNLLEDENPEVATLAMEQLLKQGTAAEKVVTRYQDSSNKRLRKRIHQLNSVVSKRNEKQTFINAVNDGSISLWEGICRLNFLYAPRTSISEINEAVDGLVEDFKKELKNKATTSKIAAYMRKRDFFVPEEEPYDVDFYLAEGILAANMGSPSVLCALTQHLGSEVGWSSTIVLHDGRFCLVDKDNALLNPAGGWHVSRLKPSDYIHACSGKDVLLAILGRLFLGAVTEGELYEIYLFGDLLSSLSNSEIDSMPYPLGKEIENDTIHFDDDETV